jgi:hypothetical protein
MSGIGGTICFASAMSRIDDLPADRRAVLQLLLRQGKSYDDLASLLRIEPATVRERARDALDRLGPSGGADLDADDQDEIADYLLGQQSASARAQTRSFLEGSPEGRGWARVVSGELRAGGMASDTLPDIPAEGTEVDEAFGALAARREARGRQEKSSRLGGAILLVAALVVAALVVVLLSGGDDKKSDKGTVAGGTTAAATSTATTPPSITVLGQVNLKAPSGKPIAVAQLVRQGTQTAMVFAGQDIARLDKKTVYALWLTKQGAAPVRLGFIDQTVPKNGKLNFSGALPDGVDPTKYDTMLMTRETTADPKSPGPTALSGAVVKSSA